MGKTTLIFSGRGIFLIFLITICCGFNQELLLTSMRMESLTENYSVEDQPTAVKVRLAIWIFIFLIISRINKMASLF